MRCHVRLFLSSWRMRCEGLLLLVTLSFCLGEIAPPPAAQCGAGPDKANTSLPQYLIIGDSISIGYSPYLIKNLTGKYEAQHVHTNADNSDKGKECLSVWLGEHKWDLISYNFGLHDIANDTEHLSIDVYSENMENITSRLVATKAKVLWVNTTPVPNVTVSPGRSDADVVKYNAAAAVIAKKHDVPIDDLHGWVIAKCGEHYKTCPGIQRPANVHYEPAGYEYLVQSLVTAIEKL
ncbi:uncharacterized protein [Oscarella lobularis]|uniref:uncharacterized protein n=1 Tax=Oscarella lobularis TaxID=121494 RepID=UPI0033137F89